MTEKFRARLHRLARYRFAERQRGCCRRHESRTKRYIPLGGVIRAPKVFHLIQDGGEEIARFLRAVSDSVLIKREPVRLNFRETESFHVPGTILLFAELDRIISVSGMSKPITIVDPFRRRPREVLKQIGIHTLTGDSCNLVPEREDVVYWKATKGNTQTGSSYASLIESVAERANRDHVTHLEVSGLWRSVSEAVSNSVDHAYKKPRSDGFQGLDDTRWWMFSQIKDAHFSLAVCDLGCGYRRTINETLPEKFIAAFAASVQGRNRDSIAIDTAMEYGRSGTHQSNRGKGSRDALSLLAKHGTGGLIVLSNTGWMRYSFRDGKETKREYGSLGIDIGGTVVWWSLPLTENVHVEN